MVVYWANCNNYENGLIDEPPQRVLGGTEYKSLNFGEYARCYAQLEYFKNVYSITSVEDLIMKKGDGGYFVNKSQDWYNSYIEVDSDDVVKINWQKYFFCEEPLEMEIIEPTFTNTDFTKNVIVLPAILNIGKWFRPVHPAFRMNDDANEIQLKENQTMYYVRFKTDKKIKFKQFRMNNVLYTYSRSCTNLKVRRPFLSLNKVYELFHKAKYKNKILKEIKRNLVE